MHRDLKPENILLESNKKMSDIKLIDFGFSVRFGPGKNFTKQVGTPYYIAPDILRGSYGNEADIWSIGVITYIVLSGLPPFNGFTNEEIIQKIKVGKFNFIPLQNWKNISDVAKDFISGLLTKDAKKRPTA